MRTSPPQQQQQQQQQQNTIAARIISPLAKRKKRSTAERQCYCWSGIEDRNLDANPNVETKFSRFEVDPDRTGRLTVFKVLNVHCALTSEQQVASINCWRPVVVVLASHLTMLARGHQVILYANAWRKLAHLVTWYSSASRKSAAFSCTSCKALVT